MSWNVESLGTTKMSVAGLGAGGAASAEITDFIAAAVDTAGASIVGLMEIKSGIGQEVANMLLLKLENLPLMPMNAEWRARVSARQDAGTMEEYVILWRHEAGVLELDAAATPAPAWLVGVVDDNALECRLEGQTLAPGERKTLLEALVNRKYVEQANFGSGRRTRTYRIPLPIWQQLQGGAVINFAGAVPAPPAIMTPGRVAQLSQRLVEIDTLRFNTPKNRAPFVANFLVGNPSQRLTIALFHAPGPSELSLGIAINLIGQCGPLQPAPANPRTLLLMGDFNVPFERIGVVKARGWSRAGEIKPRTWENVFAPISGAPLLAPSLMGNVATSLTNRFYADANGAVQLLPEAVRNNAFDKFFFRAAPGGQVAVGAHNAVDLVAMTAANQGALMFQAQLSASSLRLFRALRGASFLAKQAAKLTKEEHEAEREVDRAEKMLTAAQKVAVPGAPAAAFTRVANAQNKLQTATTWLAEAIASQAALATFTAMVANPGVNVTPGVGTAAASYRHAVSDHLPICAELQVPP